MSEREQPKQGLTGIQGEQGVQGYQGVPATVTQEEIDFYEARRARDIKAATSHIARRATVGFLILLAAFVFVYTTATREATESRQKISVVAHRADDLAREIQAQRLANIRTTCEDTNTRHDRAVKSLRALIPADRTPAERARSIIVVDALADAVAPKKNCDEVVRNAQRSITVTDPKPNG